MLLNELKPVGQARYDPARACLPGTRETILEEVVGWSQRTDTLDNLLWVHGQAGLGKSAIAASVCKKLEEKNLLAVSFFCKRDDSERRDPQRVLASIIHGVAVRHSSYAEAVATAIQSDSLICSSPIQTQYDRLIREPLGRPTLPVPAARFVIVVDALDECGTTNTRRQLLGYLHMISQLVSWLKIVITSRPDPDIKEYFDRDTTTNFSRQDVYLHNASNDIQSFVRQRVTNSPKYNLLPENTVSLLTQGAAGLFIWAQTACEFILRSHDPLSRLDAILRGATSTHASNALDALYTTAIEASLVDSGDDDAQIVRQCLGAIVVCSTRKPLSVAILSELLGDQIKISVLQSVVRSLGSVLYTDDTRDSAVRVYHPSFADYLTDPNRSQRFCIDIGGQNASFTKSCLESMMAGL
jgi:hypothetical protein